MFFIFFDIPEYKMQCKNTKQLSSHELWKMCITMSLVTNLLGKAKPSNQTIGFSYTFLGLCPLPYFKQFSLLGFKDTIMDVLL
jgi:hypothetical protein